MFWLRSGGDPMFTGDDGTDYVLNAGSQWQSETASTTGAASTNTIATPVATLADGDQTFVEVYIFGEDAADATNTYFRHQVITFYRDGGGATQWGIEDSGPERRLGTFPTTLTAGLTTSTNAIIVNADTTGIGGGQTIDWTVLYLTRATIVNGVSAGGSASATNVVNFGGASTSLTATETWFRLIDSGGSTTKPTESNGYFHWHTAYAGQMLRATFFCLNDPGSTTVRVYRDFETTASISATVASATALGSGYIATVEFAATDTFEADETLIVSIQTTNTPDDTGITLYATLSGVTSGSGGGGGTGSLTTVDKRGASKTTTSSASASGGTATGSINLGIDSGAAIYLKVTANGNTTNSNIEFWRDSGKTDQIYQATGKDAYTSAFADGTPWSLITASDLESQSIYYTITNNGSNASTYDIELLAHGE